MKAKKVIALVMCAAMVAGMSASSVMAADMPEQFKDLKANEAYDFPMMVKSFQSTYWEAAMKGMLDPEYEEKILGTADIRQIFKFSKVGNIAGCSVSDGVIKRDAQARIIRDGVVIYDGKIGSLQREKDSVKEVKKGYECGITIDGFNDIKTGDTIEAYEMVEVKR